LNVTGRGKIGHQLFATLPSVAVSVARSAGHGNPLAAAPAARRTSRRRRVAGANLGENGPFDGYSML